MSSRFFRVFAVLRLKNTEKLTMHTEKRKSLSHCHTTETEIRSSLTDVHNSDATLLSPSFGGLQIPDVNL